MRLGRDMGGAGVGEVEVVWWPTSALASRPVWHASPGGWRSTQTDGSGSVTVLPVAGRVGHSIRAALTELLRL